jgi:hypothetical protein
MVLLIANIVVVSIHADIIKFIEYGKAKERKEDQSR